MSKLNTKKAITNIDSLIRIGEEISNAAPDLLRLKESFFILDKNADALRVSNIEVINSFSKVVDDFAFIDFASFDHSIATGSTAVIATNSSDYIYTNEHINNSTKELLIKIKNSALPANQISEIRNLLSEIDSLLVSLYNTTFQTFSQWKINLKSNSDFAKDLRLLIEGVRGFLKVKAGQEKKKDFSWNKIYDTIGIQRASNKDAFLKQRKIYETLHKELTEIMKKIISVDKDRIEFLVDQVNNHIYSILNLVDKSKFK